MPQISFTIDGKKVSAEKGTMVLQAALDAGVFIPHYCYHPSLSVAGNCRMCMIEVVPKPPPGAPAGWKAPPAKPAVSCATEAMDGMEVLSTGSRLAKEAREGVLEFLLANHPLDCPVCDQAGECDLQDFSFQYGKSHARFAEDKATKHAKDFGPEVRLYGNRCINCTRCVRFTQEIIGTGDISQVNRGDHSVVDVFPGKSFDSPLAGNVVDICPVGALVSRDFLHKARVWQLDETRSVCPHCSSGCSIDVHTRDEEVMRLKPRHNPEVNGWWMCDMGRLGYKYVNDPKRIHTHSRKTVAVEGGGRETISFHAAVEEVARGLAAAGDGAWAIASAWMTNEELFSLGRLVPAGRTALVARGAWEEQRFYPQWGDSERNPSLPGQMTRGALHKDGATFVIESDRNPNRTGATRILGAAACAEPRLDELIAACEAGRVKALLLVSGMPDWTPPATLTAALAKVPFIAVIDVLEGPLSALATVVIPGAVFAEKEGTYTNGRGTTQRFLFAKPTPGQARPELETLHAIAQKTGTASVGFSASRVFSALALAVPEFSSLGWANLAPRGQSFVPHQAAHTDVPQRHHAIQPLPMFTGSSAIPAASTFAEAKK